MPSFLILSNGHGEDLSGSLIGQELKLQGHKVEAMPLVGQGDFYNKFAINVLGKLKTFTTGGLGYTSLKGRLKEVFQGQIIYLLQKIIKLLYIVKRYDCLIVVGDIVPILAAWLTRKRVIVYLVAYSSHYEGKLRLPWPSQFCLRSSRFITIYSRDSLTAKDLSRQLKRPVIFLGNPFMDQVVTPVEKLSGYSQRIGILPGSRLPEVENNIILLLKVVVCLPHENLLNNKLSLDMALINSLSDANLSNLINNLGWKLVYSTDKSKPSYMRFKDYRVNIYRNSFINVLQSSDVVLAMAGTATEQAVGLSKPVVQLSGSGPQFTVEFAEAQRRLLGPTVFCVDTMQSKKNKFETTAELIIDLLDRVKDDSALKNECNKQALNRLGTDASTANKIVVDLLKSINL